MALASGGEDERGAIPAWYMVIKAARVLGVPPWELLEREAVWMHWALAAKSAENKAQAAQRKRAEFKAK